MKLRAALVAAPVALLLLSMGCGDGGGGASDSAATQQLSAYARDLCGPMRTFVDAFGGRVQSLDADDEEGLGLILSTLNELEGPLTTLRDDIAGIEPPDAARTYHDGLLRQLHATVTAIRDLREGGVFGALTASTPVPTPDEPEGLDRAVAQECGEDFVGLFDRFRFDFSGEQ